MEKITAPWASDASAVVRKLESDAANGLVSGEAERRLAEWGENRIARSKPITFWDILLEEIREPMILLLIVIGVAYSVWGDLGDTVTILLVILAVTLVEVGTEYRAKKSIEALRTLAQPTSWAVRDGGASEIPTERLVPGDVLLLKSGVKVGADARVLESLGLEADESQLTGEAMGVPKTAGAISPDSGPNDRPDMVHRGSVVLGGRGTAIVTATGMDTELGRIAGLTGEAREPKTPLQKSMKQLSKTLVWVAVFFSALIPALGLLRGLPLPRMILTGLSFAFATVPEELPIIVTMVLGLGAIRLSRKRVLIRRTRAAETLSGVTVIATDKTGTLTENRMSVAFVHAEDERALFALAALSADVEIDAGGRFLGDPMDRAVVLEAAKRGIDRDDLLREYRPVRERGFDEAARTFTFEYRRGDEVLTVVKGAPESVFALSPGDAMRGPLAEALATGYRTIAVACGKEGEAFTLIGILGFDDPIREGVREAVADCRGAGIEVVMVTGDHAATAKRVAESAGIRAAGTLTGEQVERLSDGELAAAVRRCTVFARISPEQKLRIVNALRENGGVVAVTGDGINDAPALKAADIGIAMGVAGTDVAKEAADMILTDDGFASIVVAVEEGRRLFDNLSKCVKYYLACKVGLILSVLIPMLLNLPLPFSPVQIIILELFMDLAASTSFVAEKAESDLLKRRPRDPKESFMNRRMNLGILSGGATLAAIVLGTYLSALRLEHASAQTFAFVAWLFGHVALAFNMRTDRVPLTKAGVLSSGMFDLWAGGVVLFLAVVLNVPVLREYLQLEAVGIAPTLCLALAAALVPSWMELRKIRAWNRKI